MRRLHHEAYQPPMRRSGQCHKPHHKPNRSVLYESGRVSSWTKRRIFVLQLDSIKCVRDLADIAALGLRCNCAGLDNALAGSSAKTGIVSNRQSVCVQMEFFIGLVFSIVRPDERSFQRRYFLAKLGLRASSKN